MISESFTWVSAQVISLSIRIITGALRDTKVNTVSEMKVVGFLFSPDKPYVLCKDLISISASYS